MDELKPIFLLITSGLLFRFTLTFTGQAWAKSHAQTITFMVLPVITYVIKLFWKHCFISWNDWGFINSKV